MATIKPWGTYQDEAGNFWIADGEGELREASQEQADAVKKGRSTGDWGAFVDAVGHGFAGLATGISNLVGDWAPEGSAMARAPEMLTPEAERAALEEIYPKATFAGDMVAPLSTLAIPGVGAYGAPASIMARMGLNAAFNTGYNLLDENMEASTAEKVLFGLASGPVGEGVGWLGARVARNIKGYLAGKSTRGLPSTPRAQMAEQHGIEFTPGERLGDRSTNITERRLLATEAGPRAIRETVEGRTARFDQMGATAMGVPNADISEGMEAVVEEAAETLGREFGDIAADMGQIRMSGRFLSELGEQARDSEQLARLIKNNTGIDIFTPGDGPVTLPASDVMTIRSLLRDTLTPQASMATKKNSWRLINELDDMVQRQAGGDVAERYAKARTHWRALETIDKGKAIGHDGHLKPKTLASNFKAIYGNRNPVYGYGPAADDVQALREASMGLAGATYDVNSLTAEKSARWYEPREMAANAMAESFFSGGWAPDYETILGPVGPVGPAIGRGGARAALPAITSGSGLLGGQGPVELQEY